MVGNTKYRFSSSAVGILGAIYKQEEKKKKKQKQKKRKEEEEENNYLNTQMTKILILS